MRDFGRIVAALAIISFKVTFYEKMQATVECSDYIVCND